MLEMTSYYKRPYSSFNSRYDYVEKRHQFEQATPTPCEIIDLSALEDNCTPMEDFSVKKVEAPNLDKTKLMETYMLNILKSSDQIAKRMLFHDLISFRLSRGERQDFVMKQ